MSDFDCDFRQGLPAAAGGVDRAIRVSTAAVVLAVAGVRVQHVLLGSPECCALLH
jgi:hypothetical protein